MQHLATLLSAERWTASAPAAAEVPLVLEWRDREARPKDGLRLPAHVREVLNVDELAEQDSSEEPLEGL